MGYQNAPDIEPQIGDKVYVGVPPNWDIVTDIRLGDSARFQDVQ